MSLEAFIWAANLPLDVVGSTAYRVLLKLANHAHSDGRNAWRSTARLADELGCTRRTAQRAINELRLAGLIYPGDQRMTRHMRGDRRPVVYDLNMTGIPMSQLDLDGVTDSVTPYGVTNMSRGDSPGPSGATTAVAHRTVIEPSTDSSRGNHRDTVTPSSEECRLVYGHRRGDDPTRCARCGAEIHVIGSAS